MEIKKIRPGDYIMYKDEPYRIKKNQIVVTGTHSHTKNRLDMVGLFSGKAESATFPPHERLEGVDIVRKKAQLLSRTGGSMQIMDLVSYETFDAMAQGEVAEDLTEGDEVTYIEFQGRVIVMEKRGSL